MHRKLEQSIEKARKVRNGLLHSRPSQSPRLPRASSDDGAAALVIASYEALKQGQARRAEHIQMKKAKAARGTERRFRPAEDAESRERQGRDKDQLIEDAREVSRELKKEQALAAVQANSQRRIRQQERLMAAKSAEHLRKLQLLEKIKEETSKHSRRQASKARELAMRMMLQTSVSASQQDFKAELNNTLSLIRKNFH